MSTEALNFSLEHSAPPETHTDPKQITKALRSQAEEYTLVDSRFTLLDDNSTTYPCQDLETRFFEPKSLLSPDDVVEFSKLIDPRISELITSVGENLGNTIANTSKQLANGKNVMALTNHKDILDVAYALAAIHVNLQRTPGNNFSSSIIIGKMVSHLGYQTEAGLIMPLTEILGFICDRIYFSYPTTSSTKGTNIDPEFTSDHNTAMLQELERDHQKNGGNLLAIAGSGTTKSDVLGTGTTSLITGDYLILPAAVSLPREGQVALSFTTNEPYKIENKTIAKQAMSDIDKELRSIAEQELTTLP